MAGRAPGANYGQKNLQSIMKKAKSFIPLKSGTPSSQKTRRNKAGKAAVDYSKLTVEQRQKALKVHMVAVAAASGSDVNEALGVLINATLQTLHSIGLFLNNKDEKKADAFVEQIIGETYEQIKADNAKEPETKTEG